MEIFPSTITLKMNDHWGLIPSSSKDLGIKPPSSTAQCPEQRTSSETSDPAPLSGSRPATCAPLDSTVHAGSSNKADVSNFGVFVGHAGDFPWLQSILTINELKRLLLKDYSGQRIDRMEFPEIRIGGFPNSG